MILQHSVSVLQLACEVWELPPAVTDPVQQSNDLASSLSDKGSRRNGGKCALKFHFPLFSGITFHHFRLATPGPINTFKRVTSTFPLRGAQWDVWDDGAVLTWPRAA